MSYETPNGQIKVEQLNIAMKSQGGDSRVNSIESQSSHTSDIHEVCSESEYSPRNSLTGNEEVFPSVVTPEQYNVTETGQIHSPFAHLYPFPVRLAEYNALLQKSMVTSDPLNQHAEMQQQAPHGLIHPDSISGEHPNANNSGQAQFAHQSYSMDYNNYWTEAFPQHYHI